MKMSIDVLFQGPFSDHIVLAERLFAFKQAGFFPEQDWIISFIHGTIITL